MDGVLVNNMDATRQACKRFHVVWLDVFGSALREDFEPDRSDIHFLMDFGPMSPLDKQDA
jgi:predicted nucleotidyltransferase